MRFAWIKILLGGLVSSTAFGQTYHNIVNRPFETVSNGPQSVIVVDIDRIGRSPDTVKQAIIQRVEQITRAQIESARPLIQQWKRYGLVSNDFRFPIHHVVVLRKDGKLILPPPTRGGGRGTLTFQFSSNPEEQFPSAYQTLLQNVITTVMPPIRALYGDPAQTRTITIVNYDAEIGDRDSVAGGIYDVSNDRFLFPVYNANESAAMNLTHLIVHAFHGSNQFAYDAWEEGFARAITVKVARTTLKTAPWLDDDNLEIAISNTYDARSFYDLWNQPGLGSPSFIATSLKQPPIPEGTTGGLWLVRYLMAGSAWLKVLTEYPNFCQNFNSQYYAQLQTNPNLKGNVPGLLTIAEGLAPTVEGQNFRDWYRRQYVLDTSVTFGKKIHAQVLPYVSEVKEDETAVFVVFLTHFQTLPKTGGLWDETLLNATCYPVYWDFQYVRLTVSPQYERVDIRNGTGSVVPSLSLDPEEVPQRVTVDFSTGTENVRVAYPAGSVQGVNFRNDFFGVVYGLDNGKVNIQLVRNGIQKEIEVKNGAFGTTLPAPGIDSEQQAILTFKNASNQVVGTARTNVGTEFHAVVVYLNNPNQTYRLQLPTGLHMISLPLRPFTTDMATLLGIPGDTLLLAHWRQERFNYVYYPETPAPAPGVGFFLQLDQPLDKTIEGLAPNLNDNITLGLQVGWNLIGTPFNAPVRVSDLRVAWKFDEPADWNTAIDLGWVGSKVYTMGTSGYEPIDQSPHNNQLVPGKAYFVRVLKAEGVSLTVPPPSRSRAMAERNLNRAPQWATRLSLTTAEGTQKAEAVIGFDPKARDDYDALDAEAPPPFGNALGFGVEQSSWGRAAGFYQQDVRRMGTRQEWEITVRPLQPQETHILRWNYSTTPRRWRVTLRDDTTGKQIDMRLKREYRFVPNGVRRFKVIVELIGLNVVRILNLRASPTRGGAVNVQFTLTGTANVQAKVLNAAGRTLRLLQPSRSVESGTHSLFWNGRDSQERALPPGTYVLQVEAADAEGRVARAVTPVVLKR